MQIQEQVKSLETLSANLHSAASVKDKVRMAAAIFAVLGECEAIVEKFVISSLTSGGKVDEATAPSNATAGTDGNHTSPENSSILSNGSGKNRHTLAEIGRMLLTPKGTTMHGAEIERRAKAGGFESDSENFQSYLAVAFKRAGGFENVGRNNWRLNDAIPPETRPVKKDP